MSPVRRIALPLSALAVLAVGLGLLWGRSSTPLTETELIDRLAAGYVAENGGELTDCYASPGPGEAWLTVYCEGEAGRFAYSVDRNGRPINVAGGT